MRTTIVSDVFPPEPVTSAFSARDLAEELVSRGHDVTVLAPFPNRPAGRLAAGQRRRLRQRTNRDGYRLVHTWHTLSRRSRLLSRLAENISFGITSTVELLRGPAPDVVYMNTWPLFAQLLNTLALRVRGVPVVCVVHDIYPETLLSESPQGAAAVASAVLRRVDAVVYRHATVVTALNPRQAEFLASNRRVAPSKLRVVPDWVDGSRFEPDDSDRPAGPFRVRYVGSLTRMAGLDLFVRAARRLADRPDIVLELVGDGAARAELQAAITADDLDNLTVIHPLAPDDVPAVQAAADVLVLSLLPAAAENTTPSKLLYYLFSAKPVIACVDGASPAAEVVRDAACGVVLEPGDDAAFACCVRDLADRPDELVTLGANAGRHARRHFSRDVAVPRLAELVESVGARP